jgi:hypothetical protein
MRYSAGFGPSQLEVSDAVALTRLWRCVVVELLGEFTFDLIKTIFGLSKAGAGSTKDSFDSIQTFR